jgi:hypothetical protein
MTSCVHNLTLLINWPMLVEQNVHNPDADCRLFNPKSRDVQRNLRVVMTWSIDD